MDQDFEHEVTTKRLLELERAYDWDEENYQPWIARSDGAKQEQALFQQVLRRRAGAASLGHNCFVSTGAKVFTNVLTIGDNSVIAAGALIRGHITIGANSSINSFAHVAGRVQIGDGVRIAGLASIYGFNQRVDRIDIPIYQQGLTSKGVSIGDGTWVGANSVILDGVKVGAHCVIAAGAVVTKDVPDFSVAAGNPAVVVKNRAISCIDPVSLRLPRWDDQRAEVCKRIAGHSATLKILLKTKDEPERLKAWIAHHAAIVGEENLIIFDNVSSDPDVLATYEKMSPTIPTIRFAQFHNMVHHTVYYAELYAALKESCDYFIFLDTDEYLVMYDDKAGIVRFGEDILGFLKAHERTNIFPCAWISNLRGHADRFMLAEEKASLISGLKWGKPIISTACDLSEYIQHNTQVDHALYPKALTTNFLILHRHSVSGKERIKANLQKLVAYKVLKPGQGVEEVAKLDIASVTPPNAQLFCRQILELEAVDEEALISLHGSFEISTSGEIIWTSPWQELDMRNFICNPHEYTAELFSHEP